MARFNTTSHRPRAAVATATSTITTVSKTADTRTFEGGAGWARTPKAELFLRSTGSFHGGEGSFYEDGKTRDDRLRQLVALIVAEDRPWLVDFATWLRGPGNIRTGALMLAVDFVHESLAAGATGDGLNRRIIDAVCQRADEPGELLAYWTALYGRKIPKPVKRGVGDAVRRLYNGKSLLKYDTASKGYRFGDVLNLVHAKPDPARPWQGDVFRYALDRRHNPDTAVPPESNHTLTAHKALMQLPVDERRALVIGPSGRERLAEAGMTWEALAGWLQGPMGKEAWEAMIPTMGIMALVRNLRNFDQAGVSPEVAAEHVVAKLIDPREIARSRMFPFRFLSAYQSTRHSLRWAYPLEQALNYSLANVPRLPGRTLILVDRSGSMFWDKMSERSDLNRADGAAIFGTALALRAENADLIQYGSSYRPVPFKRGDAVLALLKNFGDLGGTNTWHTVGETFRGHDRVIIITDEQAHDRDGGHVPADTPIYTWNFAGYKAGHGPSGSAARFTFGGLTDQAFSLIPKLEAGMSGVWPWEAPAD